MKKKVIKKTPAKKIEQTSTPLNAEDLKKIMLHMATQGKMDESTFSMLFTTKDSKIQTALKKNTSLTKEQKHKLGIVEVPFIHTAEWKKLPTGEAKQHLFEALENAAKDFSKNDESGSTLRRFIIGSQPEAKDLHFSKKESKQILDICRNYLNKDIGRYRDFVSMLLRPKGWKLQLDSQMISEAILTDSVEFIRLMDTLPKAAQAEVIDSLAKSPISIRTYIAFVDYCFSSLIIWEGARGLLRLGYSQLKEQLLDNRNNKIPEWTPDFLRKVRLSQKDQVIFDKIINKAYLDSYYGIENLKCPDEVIEAALGAGMTFVKAYKTFDAWLIKKLKATTTNSPRSAKDTSMSEQIAEWICSDGDNAHKICEVVELAGLKSV